MHTPEAYGVWRLHFDPAEREIICKIANGLTGYGLHSQQEQEDFFLFFPC